MSSDRFSLSWTDLTSVQVLDQKHARIPDGTFGVAALPSEAWTILQTLIEGSGDWCDDNELASLSYEHVDQLVGEMERLVPNFDRQDQHVSSEHAVTALMNLQNACKLARDNQGSIVLAFH